MKLSTGLGSQADECLKAPSTVSRRRCSRSYGSHIFFRVFVSEFLWLLSDTCDTYDTQYIYIYMYSIVYVLNFRHGIAIIDAIDAITKLV